MYLFCIKPEMLDLQWQEAATKVRHKLSCGCPQPGLTLEQSVSALISGLHSRGLRILNTRMNQKDAKCAAAAGFDPQLLDYATQRRSHR